MRSPVLLPDQLSVNLAIPYTAGLGKVSQEYTDLLTKKTMMNNAANKLLVEGGVAYAALYYLCV